MKQTKHLSKSVLTALVLAAAAPGMVQADAEFDGVLLAAGCGSKCGNLADNYGSTGSTYSTGTKTDYHHAGQNGSQSHYNTGHTNNGYEASGAGYGSSGTSYGSSHYNTTNSANRSNGMHHSYSNDNDDDSDNYLSDMSSYQGTTTGPGPNGGYPAAPRGNYQTNYDSNTHDWNAHSNNNHNTYQR